jgi:drug/metabolite transporter (DMT)-like permease
MNATVALVIGLFSIGFSALFVRWAEAPGAVTSFYRMAVATAVMAAPFWRHWRRRGYQLSRPGVVLAAAGGLLFAGDLILWATGITLSGATIPTLMANTAPLWVGLGSLLIFRERQGPLFWVGLALAMAGAALILGRDLAGVAGIGLGSLMGLGAAVFYGSYYLVTQRGRGYLSTLAYFWITCAFASLALLVANFLLGYPLTGYSATTYLNFLAQGVIVQVAGWLAINYAQGYLPAAVVAPTLLGQPVVTAVLAVWLLDEQFTIWHLLGGAAVLAGVYLVHWSRSSGRRAAVRAAAPTD